MDSFWPIILFAVISIIIDRLDSKKKPPAKRPKGTAKKNSDSRPQIVLRGPHGLPLPFPVPEQPAERAPSEGSGSADKFGFEIPTLKNEPPKKGETILYRETETVDVAAMLKEQEEAARKRARELEKKRREAAARIAEAERYASEVKIAASASTTPATHHPLLNKINPTTARDAIVLAEIIGKPKAYRNSSHLM